jgi:hypothetical protein
MRTVGFRRLLDDKNVVRVSFVTERNRVLRFVVQLECRFNGEWEPVVRYDTAHGFAHRDVLHPSGKTDKTETAVRDYNEALTFAIHDLTGNWAKYRRRYEEWLK